MIQRIPNLLSVLHINRGILGKAVLWPVAKNSPDGTSKCPNVRGEGELPVRESGPWGLEERKCLQGELEHFLWVEKFSEVAKGDLLLSKNNIIIANAKPAGNEYTHGYSTRQLLAIETNNDLRFSSLNLSYSFDGKNYRLL